MTARRRPALWLSLGTLAAFLASIAVPRAGMIVHRHSGGDHAHVHLGETESAAPHNDHDSNDEHDGDGDHHDVAHHQHRHGGAEHRHGHHHEFWDEADDHYDAVPRTAAARATHGKPVLSDREWHHGAAHWHAQHPFLLFLPSAIVPPAVLLARPRNIPSRPASPVTIALPLPLARGPPSISVLPTFEAF